MKIEMVLIPTKSVSSQFVLSWIIGDLCVHVPSHLSDAELSDHRF